MGKRIKEKTGNGMISGLIFAAAAITFTAYGTAPETLYEEAAQRSEMTVEYGELDLQSESGARVLLRRIERAAAKVCGNEPRPVELWKHNPYRECVTRAMDRAVYGIDAPLVTELYERNKAGDSTARQSVSQE